MDFATTLHNQPINKLAMKRVLYYAIPIALCFVVGWTAMLFQRESLAEWYPTLAKPAITPPNELFPIAWSIIYICMGLSIGRLLSLGDRRFVWLWVLQLLLNFLWSPMFFAIESPIAGLAIILMLDIAVLSYAIVTWRASRFASLLMLPYLAWLGLASYLNFYIWLYN